MIRPTLLRAIGTLALTLLLLLSWRWSAAAPATTDDLGGAERYLTHVSTDKPIYRLGETVYVRGVVLHAKTRKPITGYAQATIEIKGPKGDTVASGNANAQESVIGFSWGIPDGTAGGEYRVKLTFPWDGHAPAERKFEIRAYRPPRLNSQIVFIRDGYGPGDRVSANLHSERAEGGIPKDAKVTAVARVDGTQVHSSTTRIDARGNCSVSFDLPEHIARGDGTLAMIIEDGGVVETASKTIPILLRTIDLTMYAEGGDLIAALPARVYLAAKTPAGKPADLVAAVYDKRGREVTRVRTEHEGRGRFTFTPKAGQAYTLKVVEPSGIDTTYALPEVKKDGAVIATVDDVVPAGAPVKLRIGRARPGRVQVTLRQRETVVAETEIEFGKRSFWSRKAQAGEVVERSFEVPKDVAGVLVATVWDGKNPLAERLIYREPRHHLQIAVKADKKDYITGEPVKLTITTTDERGKPVPATVGVTVTNESVLEMIDKREQPPRLPVMVLLEDEVKELADAHVYLDAKNPKAPLAVDLLLGTQGWRRFALVNTADFIATHGDAARRVLALRMPSQRERLRAQTMEMAAEAVMGAGPPRAPRAAVRHRVRRQPKPQPRAMSAKKAPPRAGKAADLRAAMAIADEVADRDMLFAEKAELQRNPGSMVYVREYAHEVRAGRKQGDRVDFTETLYWSAGVKTNDRGRATVRFDLSDAVTSFAVHADGFTANGALGTGTSKVESVEPFYITPKMPLVVTEGDVIQLPVAMVNGTSGALGDGTLAATAAKGIRVKGEAGGIALAGKARQRRLLTVDVGNYVGKADFVVEARAGAFSDKVTKQLDVEPLGFPIEVSEGGMLAANRTETFTVDIPQEVVPGSMQTDIAIYPTPLANMTQALERLMREPNGCFEQTSSTNYPLVMAQQYFTTHTGVDPAVIQRSQELLRKGYKRLVSFECRKKGYEWFGEDPGHEALSAYGLMEFTDMAQVMKVDRTMLANTRKWLLGTRDGKGGFKNERRALHTWLVDPELHNGYITWALLETGEKSIEKEKAAFIRAAASSKNSYVTALGANVAGLAGDRAAATSLNKKLAERQTKEGWVDGGTQSIVGSRGQALQVETTALATIAWLRDPAFAGAVEKSIRWLSEVCEGGRYGSTQSTVLALKAIVEYDRSRAKPKAPGSVQVLVDGRVVGEPVAFGRDTTGAIALPDISDALRAGKRKVQLRMTRGADMPFSLAVRFHTQQPASSDQTRVYLRTVLEDRVVAEGKVTEVNVTMVNTTTEPVPTPVAIIGIPGGLEVRHDQLKELKKAKRIAAYEVIGRDVVLYWRELKSKQTVKLPISLVAAVPGTYTGPASRAYEYYADEFKHWVPGLKVEITPR